MNKRDPKLCSRNPLTRDDAARLADVLRELRDEGVAIVLVEHDVSLVRALADRVVVLAEGRVVAEGAPDEVWALPA